MSSFVNSFLGTPYATNVPIQFILIGGGGPAGASASGGGGGGGAGQAIADTTKTVALGNYTITIGGTSSAFTVSALAGQSGDFGEDNGGNGGALGGGAFTGGLGQAGPTGTGGGGAGAGGNGVRGLDGGAGGPGTTLNINGASVFTGDGGSGGVTLSSGEDGPPGQCVITYTTGSMVCSGGTVTTSGIYTVHTFTSSGTFSRTG